MLTDITERKKAEEKLAWLASFPGLNPNPIAELDLASGEVKYVNPPAERLFPDLIRLGVAHPLLAGAREQANAAGTNGEPLVREVAVGDAWYLEALSLTPDRQRLRIYSLDITARKRAEAALCASEEKYRNLFPNMAEEVHFWQLDRDDDGRIKTWRLVDVNPPTLKTWGRSTVEEIREKTTDEIFGPGSTEHILPVMEKIMTEGTSYSYEDYFPHLDKYFHFTSVPMGNISSPRARISPASGNGRRCARVRDVLGL